MVASSSLSSDRSPLLGFSDGRSVARQRNRPQHRMRQGRDIKRFAGRPGLFLHAASESFRATRSVESPLENPGLCFQSVGSGVKTHPAPSMSSGAGFGAHRASRRARPHGPVHLDRWPKAGRRDGATRSPRAAAADQSVRRGSATAPKSFRWMTTHAVPASVGDPHVAPYWRGASSRRCPGGAPSGGGEPPFGAARERNGSASSPAGRVRCAASGEGQTSGQ